MSARRTNQVNALNYGGIAKDGESRTFYVVYNDANGETISGYFNTEHSSVKTQLNELGINHHEALCEKIV